MKAKFEVWKGKRKMDDKLVIEKNKLDNVLKYLPEKEMLKGLSEFFSAFSDSTRLKILTALSICEMCVNDISLILNINQTTVSHQLKILKSLHLVDFRRDGKLLFYFLSSKCVNDVMLGGVNYITG